MEISGALLARLREGSPEALADIYRAHGADLLRLATRLTGSVADGEDIVHDLFVGLPELLRRYEDRGAALPWLRGVVARLALRYRRREARHALLLGAAELASEVGDTAGPWRDIDAEQALALLPASLRTVLVLRLMEGHSHAEVGRILGITAAASRVRALRALRRLRLILDPTR